jgi:hypothetical protein
MKRISFPSVLLWFSLFCVVSLSITSPSYAEKIPALSEIPADLPLDIRVQFYQQRQALKKELVDFQAVALAFNTKDAKEQSDAEYEKLDAWRTRYINAVKVFNQKMAQREQPVKRPQKVTAYIVQFNTVRGKFSIENSDGSKLTNVDIQAGRVARVDNGTHVTTGPTGHLRIILPDETVFTIGPNSDMVIDEFVYDPDLDASKVSVRLAKGIFRWATGKVARKDPASMKVTTPVAYIGIRGTDFETEVAPDGSGYIKLFSGELEITPKKNGSTFVLKAKQIVKFNADGFFSKPEPIKNLNSQMKYPAD